MAIKGVLLLLLLLLCRGIVKVEKSHVSEKLFGK